MLGTIRTKMGNMFVKDYYANGSVVKVCLTSNPDEQKVFVGGTLLIAESLSETSREEGPNYGSLMFVRDILMNDNMSYLGFEGIDITITDFEDNELEFYELPEQDSRFNTIYGKRAEVMDTVNHKNLVFNFYGNGCRNLYLELVELQKQLREKLQTVTIIPNTCILPLNKSTSIHELHKTIFNCKQYLEGKWTYSHKITPKQIRYVSEFLGVPACSLTKLSSLQAGEILETYFKYKGDVEYTEKVKKHYLEVVNFRPIDLLTQEDDFDEERKAWNSAGDSIGSWDW